MASGWEIFVCRQQTNRMEAPSFGAKTEKAFAIWQTQYEGLSWLEQMVREDKARDLGGNGYPREFTARAEEILPLLQHEPPDARKHWAIAEGDILLPGWPGKTVKYPDAMHACDPAEWLVITALDLS